MHWFLILIFAVDSALASTSTQSVSNILTPSRSVTVGITPAAGSTQSVYPCHSLPCKNNGTCIALGSHYNCTCILGFEGTHCEIECHDKQNDCFYYDDEKCVGVYADWAKVNCPYRCGYCLKKPECVDALAYCSSFNQQDCSAPTYAGYMRTNCRKTCGICDVPNANVHQNTTEVTPRHDTRETPSTVKVTTACMDKLGEQCLDYDDDKCFGIYESWARDHCAVRCGFYKGLQPPCVNKIDYCDAYGSADCVKPEFSTWARKTCRKFCGQCKVPPQIRYLVCPDMQTTTISTTTNITTAPTPAGPQTHPPVIFSNGTSCIDTITNCIDYVDEACVGVFEYWAKTTCPRRCGYCSDKHSCMDYIKGCSHLPNVCSSSEYKDFAITNCRQYCNYCNGTDNGSHSPSTSKPVDVAKGHMGNTFWLMFPETYTNDVLARFRFFITSGTDTVSSLRLISPLKNLTFVSNLMQPSESVSNIFEQKRNTIEQKGIFLTANRSVSVYTFSSYSNTHSDISWVPPFEALGTSYIAASYHPYSVSYISYISAVAPHPDTHVTITLNTTGTVTYNGNNYKNGDLIILYLAKYLSVQISGDRDLTGSKINSNRPIAVQTGISSFNLYHTSHRLSAGSLYIPPVNKWGKTFIVPYIETALKYAIRVIPSESDTSVTITSHLSTSTYSTNDTLEFNFPANDILVVHCNKPCFVVQIPATESSGYVTSYLVTIPAVEQYSRNYRVISPNFLSYRSHFLSVMIKSKDVSGLLMNGTTIFSHNMDVVSINSWSVLSLKVPEGLHSISHQSPYSVYGLMAYGFGNGRSYGYAGGLNM